MPELLALLGLVIATALYALLVRRRSIVRFGAETMSRAMSASNEVALTRLRGGFGSQQALPEPAIIVTDQRSGLERRRGQDRRRGRGRRAGGDRRRGAPSA